MKVIPINLFTFSVPDEGYSNQPFYSVTGMSVFLKNISFHGILLDALFEEDNQDWLEVSQLLTQGIQSGAVRPLKSTIFDHTQVEEAFRFMAQGKHIGKVLLQVLNTLLDLRVNSPVLSRVNSPIFSSDLIFFPLVNHCKNPGK